MAITHVKNRAPVDTERVVELAVELSDPETDIAAQIAAVYDISEPDVWEALVEYTLAGITACHRATQPDTAFTQKIVALRALLLDSHHIDQGQLLRLINALDADGSMTGSAALGVADNPNATPEVLIAAYRAGRFTLTEMRFVDHPNANGELLDEIAAGDKPDAVKVTYREDLPETALRTLATSQHERVREAVATRRDAPPAALAALADDTAVTVRCAVLRNPACPLETLYAALDSNNAEVELAAYRNLRARGLVIEDS